MSSVEARLNAATTTKSTRRTSSTPKTRKSRGKNEVAFSHVWCEVQLEIIEKAIAGTKERHSALLKALEHWQKFAKMYTTSKRQAIVKEKQMAARVAAIKMSARREYVRLNAVVAALQEFQGIKATDTQIELREEAD